jgi:hypothetical protein
MMLMLLVTVLDIMRNPIRENAKKHSQHNCHMSGIYLEIGVLCEEAVGSCRKAM